MRLLRLLKRSKGFTLVELMVVMSIIAILAALVIPQVTGVSTTGRATTKTNDMKVVQDAVQQFVGDNPKGETTGWPVGYPIVATPVATNGSGALPATPVALRWDSFFVELPPNPDVSKPTIFESYMAQLPPHALDTTGTNKLANNADRTAFATYLTALAAKTVDQNGTITPPSLTLTTGWPALAVWTIDSTGKVNVNVIDESY